MSEAGYASVLVQEQLKRIRSHRPRKGVTPGVFRSLAEWMVKRAGEHYLLEHAEGSWLLHVEALASSPRPPGPPVPVGGRSDRADGESIRTAGPAGTSAPASPVAR